MSSPDVKVGPRNGARPATDGLPREHVSEIQRMRILSAMAEVASEKGAGAVTVAHVVARAGVSRRTFYDLFADREECFLAAFEEAIGRVSTLVVEAYEAQTSWRERIRAGLWALLVFLDEEPATAKLCVVESLAAGPRVLERRAVVLRALVRAVDEGRSVTARKAALLPPLTAEGAVGAVLSVIHTRLSEPKARPLTGLLGELMGVIVLPYFGQAAAQKELHKPAPSLPTKTTQAHRDPLDGLEMRITYRTVRVLMVIAAHPDASNRQIAAEAGISDQGQVSKLLARLEHLGLIYNRGVGPVKGAPNAWQLTARGRHVEQAIRVQTAPR
jgi:AcrR family transcriptional regulator